MTNTETLTKAIKKAVANGWEDEAAKALAAYGFHVNDFGLIDFDDEYEDLELAWQEVVYSHEFARALWGGTVEHFHTGTGVSRPPIETWKWHLQQMVVADDPIKYLGEHL